MRIRLSRRAAKGETLNHRRRHSAPPGPLGLADIGAEGILLAGGGRAILLQIADPAIGHGVAAHSNFTEAPLERLRWTMTYVYAIVYGTEAQRAAVRERVNRAHGPVRSAAGEAPSYSAFDPALQLWVVATLYETAVDLYERIYGPLDAASADRIYREYATIGTALQVPEGLWPADRAAFGAYWSESLAALRVDAVTRNVAHQLLHPASAPWWLRAAMPLARLVTAGLLPAPVREGFGLHWNARRQRRFNAFIRICAALYPRLPRRVRHGLKDWYLSELQG